MEGICIMAYMYNWGEPIIRQIIDKRFDVLRIVRFFDRPKTTVQRRCLFGDCQGKSPKTVTFYLER